MAALYEIGVSIAMANGVSQVVALISRDLLGLKTRIGEVESAFNRLGGFNVGAMIGVGGAIGGMVELIEKTKDLSHEMVQFDKLGSPAGVTPAQKAAQKAAMRAASIALPFEVPGITQKDVVATYNAGYSPLGHEGIMKMLKPLEEFAVVVGNSSGDFEKAHADIVKAIRAGELSGAFTDPETHQVNLDRVKDFLDVAQKIIGATHNVVNMSTLLGLAQQGGPALMNLSKEGLFTELMLAQMMGGPRAGTAIMSQFQQNAGVMFKRTAEEWQKLGLLKPEEWSVSGGRVVLERDASKRLMEQFGKDPLAAMRDTLIPAMEAHGITSPEDQMLEIFRLYQRQTTERMSADLMRNMYQLIQERGRVEGGLDTHAALLAQSQDVEQALHNVGAAFKNLLYELGGDGGPIARGLNSVASAIDTLHQATNWFTGWWKEQATPKYMPITPPGASVPSITPPGGPPGVIQETPGGAGFPLGHTGKHSYNAVPPPAGGGSESGGGDVYLDGKKVTDVIMGRFASNMGGPAQGSPYFDGTWSSPAQDLSLSNG